MPLSSLVGRRGRIDFAPFAGDPDQARHRLFAPLLEHALVPLGAVEGDVGRVPALGHRHPLRQRLAEFRRRCPGVEGAAVLVAERIPKQLQVVRRHFQVLRGGVLAPLGHRAFRGLQFVLGRLLDLRVVAVREEHLPVAALVGEAVHRDEDRAAADHHALAAPGLLESDRQVELLEQRADGLRHVFDDLAPRQDAGGRGRYPLDLDGLRRQVRDRPRLQQVELAAAKRPLDVLGDALEPRLDGTAQLD